jgi:uncharacterized damage-inducible protein DinB
MSEKEQFLSTWEQEFPVTLKVLKAFPADKADFKPHERSKTAKGLAWSMVNEEKMFVEGALKGAIDFSGAAKAPETWDELCAAYETSHKDLVEKIKAASEAELAGTMQFYVAPKTMGDMPKMKILWMMVMDTIHHRGQFSVYLRLAGGLVPSIYGPTADEPWQ